MNNFVEIDGIHINPDHISAIRPNSKDATLLCLLSGDRIVINKTIDDVMDNIFIQGQAEFMADQKGQVY